MDGQPHRNETCLQCNAYLRCCRNCKFYDPVSYNQCREPQAERVKDKEMATFCSYFLAATEVKSTEENKKVEAMKKLNELFKKK